VKGNVDTYRSLANSIQMAFDSDGSPNRDTHLPLSKIISKLLMTRATVMSRSKIARKGINPQCKQTIPCVKLVKADKEMCPCNPPSGCTWLVSVDPIPKAIFLETITNSSANFKAEPVEWALFDLKMSSPSFNEDDKYYTFMDTGNGSYLYLYNTKKLKNVALTGVFEDPSEALTYTGCAELTEKQKDIMCSPFDAPIYMDMETADLVCKLTVDHFAKELGIARPDIYQNDRLDTSGVNLTV